MPHIPSAPSTAVEVLTFEEALRPHAESEVYDRETWLYVPDFYADYRYILGTRGKNPLITLGVNPSTAAPGALDNTLKSVQRIAAFNGFDSFVMFNVYAQRATSPDDMDRALNPLLHAENLKALRWLLERSERPVLWAAWGAVIEKRRYLPGCVADFLALGEEYGATWVQAGSPSKKGHPHHPLYLKKDSVVYPFDVKGYLESLGG
ncbi:MAG: DUF1643 domain-containing protein [Clostridia bacterium]|nr:DUF1643 domain-containing protein [Clostridia bacterium]